MEAIKGDDYKEEVIAPGYRASKLAYEVCIQSYDNCPAVEIVPSKSGGFRGTVDWNWKRHILEMMLDGKMHETVQNDGAGSKSSFASLLGTEESFFGLGWEIITMCADDIARSGGFPAIMANELNIKYINEKNLPLVSAVFEGYGQALFESGLVNITGKTSMKNSIISAFDIPGNHLALTWGGTCIGLTHVDKIIDSSKIKPLMPIVGLWEPGYRCNVGTFFIELINKVFGHNLLFLLNDAGDFIRALAVPSKSYAKLITRVHGWNTDGSICEPIVKIAGIAHITGSGLWEKLGEILPPSTGAYLDKMPKPANVFFLAQDMSWHIPKLKKTDWSCYSNFPSGCGTVVICETIDDAEKFIEEAKIDGFKAFVAGNTIASEEKEIIIKSRFREGKILSSLHPE